MQHLQNNMDGILCHTNLSLDDKARPYIQLQNRFLTYKHQLNSVPEASMTTTPVTNVNTSNLPTVQAPVQEPPVASSSAKC